MPNDISQWFWVFFIYAFFGWCAEVIFHAVSEGKFTNRGFLNGPICPIYGFGVIIVVLCLEPIKDNLLLLFLGSVVLTTALEFITGFALEKIFNDKWWDYSGEPYNLLGYVCLRFALIWGIACVLVVDVLYPPIAEFTRLIPSTLSIIVLSLSLALTVFDASITLIETFKLKKKLVFGEHTENGIRKVSDGVGGIVANGTLNAVEKLEEGKEAVELKTVSAISGLSAVQARLIAAYPRLKHGKYNDSISFLIHRFKKVNEFGKTGKLSVPFNSTKSIFQDHSIALYKSTFETVIDVLEARDEYTAGHSRRVSVLTQQFCKYLKIPALEAELYELSASLHDIGKVGIPDATLNKSQELTEYEWTQMRCHPDIGADIIIKSCNLESVAEIVRHHHEHWDGSGYPDGLSGAEIPKGARIVSICDAVDSMMIERVYRQAFLPYECRVEIANGKGSAFCPELVDVFLTNWKQIISEIYSNDGKIDVTRNSDSSQN